MDSKLSEPFARFHESLEKAKALHNYNAMALATANKQGRPSCRMVLLKHWNEEGFVFFTNYESRKSTDLHMNAFAALTFYWDSLSLQIRIEGQVTKVSTEESRAYFAGRPRASQLGAWASQQSRPIPSRDYLEAKFHEAEKQYEGHDIPLPPYWGGWRVSPLRIEFWEGKENRLHARTSFHRQTTNVNHWTKEILSP